jgi:hypothetical protein
MQQWICTSIHAFRPLPHSVHFVRSHGRLHIMFQKEVGVSIDWSHKETCRHHHTSILELSYSWYAKRGYLDFYTASPPKNNFVSAIGHPQSMNFIFPHTYKIAFRNGYKKGKCVTRALQICSFPQWSLQNAYQSYISWVKWYLFLLPNRQCRLPALVATPTDCWQYQCLSIRLVVYRFGTSGHDRQSYCGGRACLLWI